MRIFFSRFGEFSRFGGVVGIFVGFGRNENIFLACFEGRQNGRLKQQGREFKLFKMSFHLTEIVK